jgi:hypothetical protein
MDKPLRDALDRGPTVSSRREFIVSGIARVVDIAIHTVLPGLADDGNSPEELENS